MSLTICSDDIKAIAAEVVRQIMPQLASLVPAQVETHCDDEVSLERRMEIRALADKTMRDFREKQAKMQEGLL